MAIVIQNLANVVNILDTTKAVGEQIIQTISKTSVAKGLDNTPYDIVQFMDSEGDSIYRLKLDGLVEYQDIAGVPTLWVGTLDDFTNKINSEYFVPNSGSLPTGAATEASQLTAIDRLNSLLSEFQLKADLTETQPVSLASLPLPTGASTLAKQTLIENAILALAKLTDTQPVSASALPLPTGAATFAEQELQTTQQTALNAKLALGTSSPSIQVASSLTSVTLKALNTNRKELKIVNNGTAVLYIAESAGASLTNWAWRLEQNEMAIIDKYSGIVTGIWDVANGFAQVTETT